MTKLSKETQTNQPILLKLVRNGWREFLPILHQFIHSLYISLYIYIYIYIYVYTHYLSQELAGAREGNDPHVSRLSTNKALKGPVAEGFRRAFAFGEFVTICVFIRALQSMCFYSLLSWLFVGAVVSYFLHVACCFTLCAGCLTSPRLDLV